MARCRDVVLLAVMMAGAAVLPAGAATQGEAPVQLAQYYSQERPYYGRPPGYGRPPPRQVCWNEYRRIYVGRDQWGRPVYRTVPRRVCRWR